TLPQLRDLLARQRRFLVLLDETARLRFIRRLLVAHELGSDFERDLMLLEEREEVVRAGQQAEVGPHAIERHPRALGHLLVGETFGVLEGAELPRHVQWAVRLPQIVDDDAGGDDVARVGPRGPDRARDLGEPRPARRAPAALAVDESEAVAALVNV